MDSNYRSPEDDTWDRYLAPPFNLMLRRCGDSAKRKTLRRRPARGRRRSAAAPSTDAVAQFANTTPPGHGAADATDPREHALSVRENRSR